MVDDTFRKFLESEAEKNPFKIEGAVDKAEVFRDAGYLARRISSGDYEKIKGSWQRRSFDPIALVLRKYGLEFKGLTYTETLVDQLLKMMEPKLRSL